MKKITKSSPDMQIEDTGTPEVLAPFSAFSTLMTVYNGSDPAQQLRAPWVGAMPPVGLGDWAVVLSADPASQQQPPRDPGLYVNYAGRWVLAAPYDAMCDYSARGLEFDVYLDVKKAQAVPAGAVVYHNGDLEAKTTIPAGTGLYAAVTLDDVARRRETVLATAATVGGVKGSDSITIDAQAAASVNLAISPTWSGSHTFSGASPTIAKDQTVAANEPGPKQLITRAYAEKIAKSGGASGADPTAKLGLTAVKGTSTSFMRADAAPALDPSIAPTWSGAHVHSVVGKLMVKLADKTAGTGNKTTRKNLQDVNTPYMGIGGREYGGGYNLIGYGYQNDVASYPVLAGSQEIKSDGSTAAAFVVATRNGIDSTTDPCTVKFQVTPDGRAEITNDQTASGYTPAANELITRAYAEAKFKSSGASGADPTAKLGLTAVKGTSTSFMRADAAPALDQSIAPTWRATHAFNVPGKRMIKLADKTGAAANTTRTDLSSLDTPYMGIGGSEWNKAYYLVGYGYNAESASYPVLVGSQEVTTSDNTTGAFIVATRNGGTAADKPTVKFTVTPDGRAEITNDQTASGYTPATNELITRAYAEAKFKSSGASGADPTAKLGLTAVKGTSTSFMRADAAPALDQSITPTWSGTHFFRAARKRMIKLADETGKTNGTTSRVDLKNPNTPYIGIGGTEWGGNVNYVIGYGFNDETGAYPVLVGAQEASSSGITTSSFIVATRTGNTASDTPTVKFKVTPDGRPEMTNVQTASGYTPAAQELVTRAYVDAKAGGSQLPKVTHISNGAPWINGNNTDRLQGAVFYLTESLMNSILSINFYASQLPGEGTHFYIVNGYSQSVSLYVTKDSGLVPIFGVSNGNYGPKISVGGTAHVIYVGSYFHISVN